MRRLVHGNLMTAAVSWTLFREMEENAPGSFLDAHTWQMLRKSE